MWQFIPPLADIRFVIEDYLQLPAAWAALPAFADLDADTAAQIVEAAGTFAAEVTAPINSAGDLQGCAWRDGKVTTPAGYRDAYQAFVAAGWPALAHDPQIGGQGLPQVLNAALYEMLSAANHGWTMYPGLLHGACDCLHLHGSPALKEAYLGRIVSGEWLSTMCLTEAQAGSDLGLIRTRANPSPDGSFALSGTKIFISGGEHDLSDNIVHLVLARLADAPAGTKGLSLFLAPKLLPDGAANALRCDGIEKKMGIKGSATCVMSFEGATAWLVGEPNRGLAAMFAMMNAARLHVGLQGLGHAEMAHQNALRYAQERVQGQGRPIVEHAPMRRTLLRQRTLVEGARMLAYETAHWLDLAHHAAGDAARQQALDDVSLLTPIVKAFLTDNGFAIASDALQVFGGHGYIHDWGIEQCVRDSRIAMVYEGTNEIQAIDLLARKVVPDGAAKLNALFDRLAAALPDTPLGATVQRELNGFRTLTAQVVAAAQADAEAPQRVAVDYLRASGLLLLAQAWARADAVAAQAAPSTPLHEAKRVSAAHYIDFVLPEATLRSALVARGLQPLPRFAESA